MKSKLYATILHKNSDFFCCSEISHLEDEDAHQAMRGQGQGLDQGQREVGHMIGHRKRRQAERGVLRKTVPNNPVVSDTETRTETRIQWMSRRKDGE